MECASKALVDCDSLPRIVLNLSELKFASSSFIARLVSLHKMIRVAGGKLVLCELRPVMKEILNGARLNKLFDITEDEESALKRFAGVDE
ncbi:MAG: STAS domain-containing protein [Planctomycetes bacterium]|nr:STAS domain-containing protein [Planctomycetota bacterium]MBL7044669.1 STAS domain-containing protein [Pirellulaceae bacterium]